MRCYGSLQKGLFYPGDGVFDSAGCLLFEFCYQLRHLAMEQGVGHILHDLIDAGPLAQAEIELLRACVKGREPADKKA